MSIFRVAHRTEPNAQGEKCPICRQTYTDFIDLQPPAFPERSLLACYECGAVFVSKYIREQEKAGKKEQILRQMTSVEKIESETVIEKSKRKRVGRPKKRGRRKASSMV